MGHSKRFVKISEKFDKTKRYNLEDSIKLLKEKATVKFDETIDVSYNLNLQAKHSIRDAITLPNSFGKSAVVAVFAAGDKAKEAKDAGADFVGSDDLIAKISGGWTEFDIAIATPDMMKNLSKIAKILGPKGLMPNPKAKTVTDDVAEAVNSSKKGMKEFRADKNGIIHFSVGKISMTEDQIKANFTIFHDAIMKKKPNDIKGDYIKSITLSSTMGVGIPLNIGSL